MPSFSLDRYCLGVKDVNAGIASRFEYDNRFFMRCGRITARNRLRRPPHAGLLSPRSNMPITSASSRTPTISGPPAFRLHRPVQATEELEFGKDGKPFFIAGPNDNTARCRSILASLERSCGPKGFHYLLPMDPADGDSFEIPT